jgi:hypothetical protein
MDGPYSVYKVGDLEYNTFLNVFKKTWEGSFAVVYCGITDYRLVSEGSDLYPSVADLNPCEYLFALATNKSAVNTAKTPAVTANMNT